MCPLCNSQQSSSMIRRPRSINAACAVHTQAANVDWQFSEADMTDPYHNPDALPSSTIDAIITRLEERGRHPFFLSAINQYVAILERDRKLSILELGCGTGVVMRYVETLVHPTSVLRAADISEQFLQGTHTFPCMMLRRASLPLQLQETVCRRRRE
jgi:hypothetical protein